MRHRAVGAAEAKAEDDALALHGLPHDVRTELRAALPSLIAPILQSVQLAADTAAEPVGSLGHLAFARAALGAILDRAFARLPRK
jgi:hypothetical protein